MGLLRVATALVLVLVAVPASASLRDQPDPEPVTALDSRPNVVVVLTDDMRADDLTYMPLTRARMQAGGTQFVNAISPHPLCCPARAELHSGQYAQNNGVKHNSGKHGGYGAFDPTNSVGTWFEAADYETAFVGKYFNLYKPTGPTEPGWDHWDAIPTGYAHYFNFSFSDGTTYTDDYVTTRIEERTNAHLAEMVADGKPFLYYVNHIAPHQQRIPGAGQFPAVPAREDINFQPGKAPMRSNPAFNRPVKGGLPRTMKTRPVRGHLVEWKQRIRSLQSVDRAVESMYQTLESTGELANTYVVFTSDNGYALGEHQLYRKNLLTDESLDVPLLVTGPGVDAGTKRVEAVTLVDLVATIVDLADVPAARRLDGTSFEPALRGHRVPKFRDTTLIQTGSLRKSGWAMRGVKTDRYLYARDTQTNEQLLFDRSRDPHQLVNRVKQPGYQRVVKELRHRTSVLANCAGKSCNRRFGPMPKASSGR